MKANKQIKKAGDEIENVMQRNLASIADSIIKRLIKKAKSLPNSRMLDAVKGIKPSGLNIYKSDLKATMAVVASDALDYARNEIPKAKKVKLMENEERLLFGEFENLPPKIRKRIETSNQLLIGTQIADLEKAIFFQFNSSVVAEKDIKNIEYDVNEKAQSFIGGNSIKAGAAVTAANMVNEVRTAFFFSDEVLEEIEAFEFMNGDPVSAVCTDLAGTIFSKNDPDAFKYTPPLHYNCKSWIRPILKLKKGQEIKKLKPSTQKIEETIQFSSIQDACSPLCHDRCGLNL